MNQESGIVSGSERRVLYHAVAFLVVAIWGSTFVFTKLLLLGGFSPAQIFTLRFIIAYAMLLVFCLWRGIRWLCDSWKDELLMLGLGISGGSLYFLAENEAMNHTTTTNTSLIVCLCPLFASLLIGLFYKSQRLNRTQIIGTIIAATGLVVAQLPIPNKENEITNIPRLLSFLDIRGSTITADALNTTTNVMEHIIEQGAHFVLMVKKNNPGSYEEIIARFDAVMKDRQDLASNPLHEPRFPEYNDKYDAVSYQEKNRDRYEYRDFRVINDASFLSNTPKVWRHVKSVGRVEQTRILIVRDKDGNDITPSKEKFNAEGSIRQPLPKTGDGEKDDIQVVGLISDKIMSAQEMGKCKRSHWSVENRLHHVLDDTFREDRSPAKGSKNNLALVRKFALNILRLAQIQMEITVPFSEMMDLFCDDLSLLDRYVFREIQSLY